MSRGPSASHLAVAALRRRGGPGDVAGRRECAAAAPVQDVGGPQVTRGVALAARRTRG